MARRLLAQQPDPPRRVTVNDLLEIYGPTLAYAFVVLPVAFLALLAVRHQLGSPLIARFAVVLVAAVAVLMAFLMMGVRGALQTGVVATAEILSATQLRGRLRVMINDRAIETDYRSNYIGRLEAGDRITVLVDPRKAAVVLTLGPTL